MVNRVLTGVGDPALGEWVQKETALHVRRRLSAREMPMVGPVMDIRRTPEAWDRFMAIPEAQRLTLPAEILEDEIGALPW